MARGIPVRKEWGCWLEWQHLIRGRSNWKRGNRWKSWESHYLRACQRNPIPPVTKAMWSVDCTPNSWPTQLRWWNQRPDKSSTKQDFREPVLNKAVIELPGTKVFWILSVKMTTSEGPTSLYTPAKCTPEAGSLPFNMPWKWICTLFVIPWRGTVVVIVKASLMV